MLHKIDLSVSRPGMIVCPLTRVTNTDVFPTRDTNPHNTDYISSFQYMQRHGYDSVNTSNLTDPGNRTRGPSGLCSMFVEIDNLATKQSSRDDGLVDRLAISTRAVNILMDLIEE